MTLLTHLRLPVIGAPMFLLSSPELVIASCRAGILGSFPALNARTTEELDQWLTRIIVEVRERPFGVNLIVHPSNPRVEADLKVLARHKVPLVITSLGAVSELVKAVHDWGGLVFHDVVQRRHAEKAAQAGVDGIIAVCAGAGGHAGTQSPFALAAEIRQVFDGTLVLAGAISTGVDIACARLLGADAVYMGTRLINTLESAASVDYQQRIIESRASDVVYTDQVSGIPGNFLASSLAEAGVDPKGWGGKSVDLASELKPPEGGAKAWKHLWSAGQGVGQIEDVRSVAALVDQLESEYKSALNRAVTLTPTPV